MGGPLTDLWPSVVGGLVSIFVAVVGWRAASAKIRDESAAAQSIAESNERIAFRKELREELERMRQRVDEQQIRMQEQSLRIQKLEIELVQVRVERDGAVSERDQLREKLRQYRAHYGLGPTTQ